MTSWCEQHWEHDVCAEQYGELISTMDVCRRARVTFRMLDTWVRIGMVVPSISGQGSGTQRKFREFQVGEVCEIREIKREYRRLGDLISRKRRE